MPEGFPSGSFFVPGGRASDKVAVKRIASLLYRRLQTGCVFATTCANSVNGPDPARWARILTLPRPPLPARAGRGPG